MFSGWFCHLSYPIQHWKLVAFKRSKQGATASRFNRVHHFRAQKRMLGSIAGSDNKKRCKTASSLLPSSTRGSIYHKNNSVGCLLNVCKPQRRSQQRLSHQPHAPPAYHLSHFHLLVHPHVFNSAAARRLQVRPCSSRHVLHSRAAAPIQRGRCALRHDPPWAPYPSTG